MKKYYIIESLLLLKYKYSGREFDKQPEENYGINYALSDYPLNYN
jgi:hypothetical protein